MSALVGADGGPLPALLCSAPKVGGLLGATEDVHVVERASASKSRGQAPLASVVVTAASTLPTSVVVDVPLHVLQQWFCAVVTHPVSARAGVQSAATHINADASHVIADGRGLDALTRLEIYHYAYHARLIECLADDYPSIRHLLGDTRFDALARAYIVAHPSQQPNLNTFGRSFVDFLTTPAGTAACGDDDEAAWCFDLARLEWAMVEVIHAAPAPALSLALLSELAPDALPKLRLTPSSTLRFLQFACGANPYLQSVRNGDDVKHPAPGWSATAIYRQDWRIWRMDFTPKMAGVLRALLAGDTLGSALSTLNVDDDTARDAQLEGNVMAWFKAWMLGGFFSDMTL